MTESIPHPNQASTGSRPRARAPTRGARGSSAPRDDGGDRQERIGQRGLVPQPAGQARTVLVDLDRRKSQGVDRQERRNVDERRLREVARGCRRRAGRGAIASRRHAGADEQPAEMREPVPARHVERDRDARGRVRREVDGHAEAERQRGAAGQPRAGLLRARAVDRSGQRPDGEDRPDEQVVRENQQGQEQPAEPDGRTATGRPARARRRRAERRRRGLSCLSSDPR